MEGKAKVENEDDIGVAGADPYSIILNEIQDDEEGMPLGKDLLD